MVDFSGKPVVPAVVGVLLALGIFAACTPQPEVRLQDSSRLKSLYKGMTKREFLSIMGTELMALYGTDGRIRQIVTNPHETELLEGESGGEVLVYFTNPKKTDGPIQKEELTPFVFRGGKLAGSGWVFYETLKKQPADSKMETK